MMGGVDKIFDVVLAFNRAMRYEDLLNTILTKMIALTISDAGTLYILENGALHFKIIKNESLGIYQSADDKIDLPPVVIDADNVVNISAYAAINNEAVVIDDVYTCDRFNFAGPKQYDALTGYRTQSMLVLPLSTYRNDALEVLGVIQLINAQDPATKRIIPYGDINLRPELPALANIAASTLCNLIHIREVRVVFQSFVSAMVRTIDERSKYNSNHTHKVAMLCESFVRYLTGRFPKGHALNFDENRLEEIIMAATLHDVGKIVTPIHIMDKADRLGDRLPLIRLHFTLIAAQLENQHLRGQLNAAAYAAQREALAQAQALVETLNTAGFVSDEDMQQVQKLSQWHFTDGNGTVVPLLSPDDVASLSVQRGTLTDAEREIIQEHASITGRFLDNIAFGKYYKHVAQWAQSHHELLDGKGYPRGLSGNELSIEGCIITIMDIFEALTASDRPYKRAMSVAQAFDILHKMANEGKLHKELVQLFEESQAWNGVIHEGTLNQTAG